MHSIAPAAAAVPARSTIRATPLSRPASRVALASILAVAATAYGEPSLDRIEPPGGRQGSRVEIRITGTDLDRPQELFFEESRIRVDAIAADKDNVVTATLDIPADCPPGPHRLRVRTADGLSDLRMFQVHCSEQVQEKEPNDSAAAAMPLEPGRAVWGTLRNEDVDCFKIHLPAGGRISAVVDAVRLDQQMLDAHLDLVDEDGFVIASCDDHPLLTQDPALVVTVPQEGDYYLRVREAAYSGNGVYQLHVGGFPVPNVAWPPGGSRSKPFDVEWLGDPAGGFRQRVELPAAGLEGLARVYPVRDGVTSPAAVPLRVTDAPVHIETEPNDEPEQAASARAPLAVAGRMQKADDVDWIRIEAEPDSKWRVTGWGRRLGSPVDLVIAAHRDTSKRERITSNDDTDGPDSSVQVTVPKEGAFLLRINDFQRRGGEGFVYWIDVEPMVPQATVSVPPATTRTQQRLVAAVPRGNRMALFFNASRTECTGPLKLDFQGLPAGVTAFSGPLAEPAPGGLVVFEAAPDAAVGTSLATVTVRTSGEHDAESGGSSRSVGGLRQGTDTVYGEPNKTTYRTALGDRLAVAVVDEAPVTIELEPPAGPLARRGQTALRVKVRRAEGFAGRVRLELPFKPPGVGASSVDLKDDETDVTVPLSASADAAVRDWQIAVAAVLLPPADPKDKKRPRRDGSGVWICSRPVALSVIEPLVELTAEKAVAEQGTETKLVFKAAAPAAFEGVAKVTLVGLPVKTEAPPLELRGGAESLEIPITVAADAPVGKHDNVFCRIEVPVGGATVIHQSAPTSLRIDKPLPGGVAARGK
jgi:hypothetical protein